MKKNRRGKKIITAVVAVCLTAVILPSCGPDQTEKAAVTPVEKPVIVTEQKENTEKKSTERMNREEPETVPETISTDAREIIVSPQAGTGTWSTVTQAATPSAGNPATVNRTAENQAAEDPVSEQPATCHVHSYVPVGTQAVEHPAVTEQAWVEDAPAWEEVIRPGYHMCVVTCHECGAQFSDPAQGNALEAWGSHIDAVHDGDGGYDMASSYDVPAETVRHDATGHYETRTVTAGWTEYIDTYMCPCGDSYTKAR